MRLDHEGSMIWVQCQLMICRGHIRASKGTFQIFLWLTVLWQIDILFNFALWSSFQVNFRKWVYPLRASKYGLMGSSILLEGHRSTFLGQKHVPFGIGHPPTYTSNLSICVRKVQGSQIFKQN